MCLLKHPSRYTQQKAISNVFFFFALTRSSSQFTNIIHAALSAVQTGPTSKDTTSQTTKIRQRMND